MALLLIDDRAGWGSEPEPSRRPDRIRVPWRVVPAFSATVACLTVGVTTDGAVGALATIAGFLSACRALDRALPRPGGLGEYRQ